MSDQLTDLLRERFTGHEMNVPPGAWEHVSGQLAANASGESLREGLQDKFRGHEVEVDPSAWANISGQLGQGAAAGTSFSTGWLAAGVAAVAVTATVLLWNSGDTQQKAAVPQKAQIKIAEVPALVSAPAATLPTLPEPEPVRKENPDRPVAVKALTPSIRQDAQRPVTSAPLPTPKPEATDVHDQAPAQTQEQDPAAMRPKVSAPAIAAPKPETAPKTNAGTDTPITGPDDDRSGTTSAEDDQVSDLSADDPFQIAATSDIFIPNVFSPQGDGVNDKLEIVARDYDKVDVRIFAAKGGALIFRSNNLSIMWDGRLPNGNIAEEGYYKCVVMLTDADGRPRVNSEVVRLFR
ncbi:MAG: gliding motility-associated C-terminal domain-containing protein [Flavobacteriales bacterium]|nr:gliding motility-associated C-terminal domain-containing protein [Flavobacteriales bacterium]